MNECLTEIFRCTTSILAKHFGLTTRQLLGCN